MREPLLERQRVGREVLVVVGEQQAAGAVACSRTGRRTRSCRRRGRARRRSSRACCPARCDLRPCGRCGAVWSALTSRTPVCRAVVVALPGTLIASRSAGTAGRCGGRRRARRAGAPTPAQHPLAGGVQQPRASSSPTSRAGRHGSSAASPARLALPHVPDPGHRALVEERVADGARRVVLAEPAHARAASNSSARMSGPSRPTSWRRRATGQQLERRARRLGDRVVAGPSA